MGGIDASQPLTILALLPVIGGALWAIARFITNREMERLKTEKAAGESRLLTIEKKLRQARAREAKREIERLQRDNHIDVTFREMKTAADQKKLEDERRHGETSSQLQTLDKRISLSNEKVIEAVNEKIGSIAKSIENERVERKQEISRALNEVLGERGAARTRKG